MGKSIAILYAPKQPPEVLAGLAVRFRNVMKLLDADPGRWFVRRRPMTLPGPCRSGLSKL